jgi:hypothetical protein
MYIPALPSTHMLQSGPDLQLLQKYLLPLLESTYLRLGFLEQSDDTFLDRRLRTQVTQCNYFQLLLEPQTILTL